jgi:hypothetical protein
MRLAVFLHLRRPVAPYHKPCRQRSHSTALHRPNTYLHIEDGPITVLEQFYNITTSNER